jgi:hypothetical protein
MNRILLRKRLLSGLLILFLLACTENGISKGKQSTDQIVNFDLPIYPEAKDVKTYFNDKNATRGVSYILEEFYPSMEVVEYYDAEMSRLGFQPFVEEYYKYADRTWQTFTDSTKKGSPLVGQLVASWIDPKGEMRATLALRYYWQQRNTSSPIVLSDNKEMHVNFQVGRFFKLPPPQELPSGDSK